MRVRHPSQLEAPVRRASDTCLLGLAAARVWTDRPGYKKTERKKGTVKVPFYGVSNP